MIIFYISRFIYPIATSYADSSEFTFWSRLKASIIANGIFYGAVGVLCVIFFLVIFFTTANKNFLSALGVAMALANSWGLFLVVCFLGVGVILNPRNMWRKSQFSVLYKQSLWKLGDLYEKYKKSRTKLFETLRCVKKYDEEIRFTDPNREFIDIIIKNCPKEYESVIYGSVDEVVKNERKKLVELNYRVIQRSYEYHCNYTRFHKAIEKTLDMEDINKPMHTRFKIEWTYPKNTFLKRIPVIKKIIYFLEWVYWIYTAKWFWRFVSILSYIATIIVLWSEITMFSSFLNKDNFPTLSIYYLLIWKIKGMNPLAMQFIAFLSISYNAWCTYKTLLTLRFFNWYKIQKHKLTNLYSIIFASAYICRISVPIVLNMIYLVGFDKSHSSFIRVMGPMSVVPFLGGNFHVIFPTVILVISILTIFNCWNRILTCFNKRKFKFNEFFTDDLIDKGKEIIAKEKAALRIRGDINYFGDNFNRIKERFPDEALNTQNSINNENESKHLLIDFESGYNKLSHV